jgi:hypothetical protein
MSKEYTAGMNQAEISVTPSSSTADSVDDSPSFFLFPTNCRIVPDAKSTPSPVSTEELKEIILRKIDCRPWLRPKYIPESVSIQYLVLLPDAERTIFYLKK